MSPSSGHAATASALSPQFSPKYGASSHSQLRSLSRFAMSLDVFSKTSLQTGCFSGGLCLTCHLLISVSYFDVVWEGNDTFWFDCGDDFLFSGNISVYFTIIIYFILKYYNLGRCYF